MTWHTFHYEIVGRGHKKTSTPCQDKTYTLSKNGVYTLALADGAGSAKLSHYGAETVTKVMCKYAVDNFESIISERNAATVKKTLLDVMLNSLNNLADKMECNLTDLASTFLFTAHNEKQFIIVHIGDGVVGAVVDRELKVISAPENGEFANTTTFVTSSDALSTMRLIKGDLSNVDGFVLMSDGTEASLYNKRNNSLAPVVKRIMSQVAMNADEDFSNKLKKTIGTLIKGKTSDDCSLAIMSRLPKYKPLQKRPKWINLRFSALPPRLRMKVLRMDK